MTDFILDETLYVVKQKPDGTEWHAVRVLYDSDLPGGKVLLRFPHSVDRIRLPIGHVYKCESDAKAVARKFN